MIHLWVRSEERPNERRVGITPEGVAALRDRGFTVTVEDSPHRIIPTEAYAAAGARIAPPGSWRDAPREAIIFGLKELPEEDAPLVHRHVMFGHAFKQQPGWARFLRRFGQGGGALYDLEYLVDAQGRRLAAFGHWAGFVGAALSVMAWAAQDRGETLGPVSGWPDRDALLEDVRGALAGRAAPAAIVIGALGRVGQGATELLETLGAPVTRWDMAETAGGGPFDEVLRHPIFINAILARPGCPVFVAEDAPARPRALRVIGDVACDPGAAYSPVRVYDRPTSWSEPVLRVHHTPPLDVVAIDNLPSLLPRESSEDFAAQLLPLLAALDRIGEGPWARAHATFTHHLAEAMREEAQ